jgi:hypothetical protein
MCLCSAETVQQERNEQLRLIQFSRDNVVVAGSAVVNTLLPVPDEWNQSKRGLREFYHEKFCPASDVDLFLYGLTEEQAIEKIKDIETRVRDSLLTETTVVRTKHAVTICKSMCHFLGARKKVTPVNALIQAASTQPVTSR